MAICLQSLDEVGELFALGLAEGLPQGGVVLREEVVGLQRCQVELDLFLNGCVATLRYSLQYLGVDDIAIHRQNLGQHHEAVGRIPKQQVGAVQHDVR
jgi:hypothetical protein